VRSATASDRAGVVVAALIGTRVLLEPVSFITSVPWLIGLGLVEAR